MLLLSKSSNCQVGGFVLASIAWILCNISAGLPQWRVWYINETRFSEPTKAFVGMWRVCLYDQTIKPSNGRGCHEYTYHERFVPWDIRVIQRFLKISNIFGLIGTVATVFALRNVHTGRPQRKIPYNPFFISAIFNTIASAFVFFAVLCNYISVIHKAGIPFPVSFHIPSQPPNQRLGIANVVASIAALMFLSSGVIFFSYTSPMENQVFPEI
ncbi:claudin-34-like [Meriones unguiculatus]|uniref:claudin-34-like n=1 Tax=Meriones unguiculatus TaxID=10047 RepID=UPI000B4F73CB|nr:claudin-34-like [Meriones unguiculatus]